MVFATETEVESSSDTAPLSPEQVANAEAKNALLNKSLGIQKDIDPTSGDETEDDDEYPHAFLHWTLKRASTN